MPYAFLFPKFYVMLYWNCILTLQYTQATQLNAHLKLAIINFPAYIVAPKECNALAVVPTILCWFSAVKQRDRVGK